MNYSLIAWWKKLAECLKLKCTCVHIKLCQYLGSCNYRALQKPSRVNVAYRIFLGGGGGISRMTDFVHVWIYVPLPCRIMLMNNVFIFVYIIILFVLYTQCAPPPLYATLPRVQDIERMWLGWSLTLYQSFGPALLNEKSISMAYWYRTSILI